MLRRFRLLMTAKKSIAVRSEDKDERNITRSVFSVNGRTGLFVTGDERLSWRLPLMIHSLSEKNTEITKTKTRKNFPSKTFHLISYAKHVGLHRNNFPSCRRSSHCPITSILSFDDLDNGKTWRETICEVSQANVGKFQSSHWNDV